MWRRTRFLREDERGFTLVELLAAMTAALVIIAVPVLLSIHAVTDEQKVQDITTSQRSLEQGMNRLTADFRQATAATVTSTTATLTVPIPVSQRGTPASNPVPPAGVTVTWTCTVGASCTRASTGGPTEALINNVTSALFSPSSATNPAYVGIAISARPYVLSRPGGLPANATPLTLRSGIDLRNIG